MSDRIRDLLTAPDLNPTPSERKIVRILLADYPMAGLATATTLARRAGVSDPTVLRFVDKLGFGGYSEFQARLLAEVEARLHSPLLMMEAKRPAAEGGSAATTYLASVIGNLERTSADFREDACERAVQLLCETRGTVYTVGGRFSRGLALMLAGYLAQLRPRVTDLGALTPGSFDLLVDIGRRDLVVAFDYRRYQTDVVAFARLAAERGARILLFTDTWLSPIAEVADVVLSAEIEARSPYDTLAPALAQMEAVITHAVAGLDGSDRRRIEAIEAIRSALAVTLDHPEDDGPPPSRRRGFRDAPPSDTATGIKS